MSSRVPSFLLGGINKTYNFFGARTVRTAGYGLVEMTVKTVPVLMVFGAAASMAQEDAAPVAATDAAAVPQRRSSLTQ